MRTLFILLTLFMFSSAPVHAAWEQYAIDMPDGTVVVKGYNTESSYTLQEEMDRTGFQGLPFTQVTEGDLPTRNDRHAWEWKNNVVSVNQSKKATKDADKAAKAGRRQGHFSRLDIPEDEFKELMNG